MLLGIKQQYFIDTVTPELCTLRFRTPAFTLEVANVDFGGIACCAV
jgi:hypothetical protein